MTKATITVLRTLAEQATYEHVYKPSRKEWETVSSKAYNDKKYLLRKGNYKKCFDTARDCFNFLVTL
jgi:hypothetical protein